MWQSNPLHQPAFGTRFNALQRLATNLIFADLDGDVPRFARNPTAAAEFRAELASIDHTLTLITGYLCDYDFDSPETRWVFDQILPDAEAQGSMAAEALSGPLIFFDEYMTGVALDAIDAFEDQDIRFEDIVPGGDIDDDWSFGCLAVFSAPLMSHTKPTNLDNAEDAERSGLRATSDAVYATAITLTSSGLWVTPFSLRQLTGVVDPEDGSSSSAEYTSSIWWPSGHFGLTWVPGQQLDDPVVADVPHDVKATHDYDWPFPVTLDRKVAAVVLSILNDPLFTETEQRAPRPMRRRLARSLPEQADLIDQPVRIVTIGGTPSNSEPPDEPTANTGTSRRGHLVRAHIRQQRYGPGRSLQRLRVIPAHIRGDRTRMLTGDVVHRVANTRKPALGTDADTDT